MKKIVLFTFLVSLVYCTNEKENNQIDFKEFHANILSENEFQENLHYLDSLIKSDKLSDIEEGIILFYKGKEFSKKEITAGAMPFFEQSLTLFSKVKNDYWLTKSHYVLGANYVFLGEKQKATENLLKSLQYAKKRGDFSDESIVYQSFAHLYYSSQDFNKAIEYLQKTEKIQQKENQKEAISVTYNNIAVLYKNMMDLESAMDYNNRSLAINKELNDIPSIAKSYNNIGQVHELYGNTDSAIILYQNAIELNRISQIHNTTPLRNLCKIYLAQKKYTSVIELGEEAIKIESNKNHLFEIYSSLIKATQAQEELNSVYSKKLDSIRSEQVKAENAEKLKMIENQYSASISEQELKQTKQNNKKNRLLFLSILLLIIIVAILFYLKNKNTQLKLAQEKLRLEQKVLRSQMNPHFIFNALTAIQNSLMDNEPLKSASYLSQFAKLIRQNFDFINKQFIPLADEIDSLTNYMETQKLRFGDKFDYRFDIDDSLDLSSEKIPPLLIQPFIENAIEHGFKNKKEKGVITIQIKDQISKIHYTITDNGMGFDVNQKTKEEHALDVFRKRMKLIGEGEKEVTFKMESNENGTSITFSLKKQ